MCHAIGDLRQEVLGVETKVMEKSQRSLNILFILIMMDDILNVHV